MHDKSNAYLETPPTSGKPPLLLADAMLGRLARWLRLVGYDTLYQAGQSDHQIAARARAEGRLVLTRDRELAKRRGIQCLLIHSQVLEEQLRQVFDELGPAPTGSGARCPQCNAVLTVLSPDQASEHVPAHVLHTHASFRYCDDCDKVYWQGSHWQKIEQVITELHNSQ